VAGYRVATTYKLALAPSQPCLVTGSSSTRRMGGGGRQSDCEGEGTLPRAEVSLSTLPTLTSRRGANAKRQSYSFALLMTDDSHLTFSDLPHKVR
jgi:hypothetical protein